MERDARILGPTKPTVGKERKQAILEVALIVVLLDANSWEQPTVQGGSGYFLYLGCSHSFPWGFLTLPRFYRHLHKGENGEIGGDHASLCPGL